MARVYTSQEIGEYAENAGEELALAVDDLIACGSAQDLVRYKAAMLAARNAVDEVLFAEMREHGEERPLQEIRLTSALSRYEVIFQEHIKRLAAES